MVNRTLKVDCGTLGCQFHPCFAVAGVIMLQNYFNVHEILQWGTQRLALAQGNMQLTSLLLKLAQQPK